VSDTKKTADALVELRRLIANDSYAIAFQTFGQYRTALLKAIDAFAAQPQDEPVAATREVIAALAHARRFAHQPCENPADGFQLKRASSALLADLNAAWRSLGLKPSIREEDAVAALAARPPVAQQGAAEGVAWRTKFDELLEDYAMARVETALFNAKVIQRGRLARPRLEALQQHVATLTPQPAAAQPVAQGLTDDVQAFFRQARAALDEAAKNPGKAVKLPEALTAEYHKFMRGEPSMFDKLPFGEVKALGALSTAHPAQAAAGDSRG
jgi:hypothetical protein